MMYFLDLLTGVAGEFPMLPDNAEFTIDAKQGYEVNPVLGGRPQVQVTGAGERTFQTKMILHGVAGRDFYNRVIKPAYGLNTGQPHNCTVSWGDRSDEAFTGRPIGMPETLHKLDEQGVFTWDFALILVDTYSAKPRVTIAATGSAVTDDTFPYVAEEGDDLMKIAKKFKVTLQALSDANNGNAPVFPKPGTTIRIPKRRNA